MQVKIVLPNNSVGTDQIKSTSVTASKIDFTTLNFGNYSTSETNTGFTWVDGKTIYKRTYSIGALANSGTKTVAHGIALGSTAVVIDARGIAFTGSGYTLPLPYVGDGGTNATFVSLLVDPTYINVKSFNDRSSYSGYVTLYYTKS